MEMLPNGPSLPGWIFDAISTAQAGTSPKLRPALDNRPSFRYTSLNSLTKDASR
jgi:hypothetical protein